MTSGIIPEIAYYTDPETRREMMYPQVPPTTVDVATNDPRKLKDEQCEQAGNDPEAHKDWGTKIRTEQKIPEQACEYSF